MNLWRLELVRLIRTNRWMIVAGVYVLFGVLGPVTAAYLPEILARFGGDIEVTLPDPQPIDGMIQFVTNVSQLGILAVVVVAAGALAIDARPEVAAFYRTRVSSAWTLLRPRYVVSLGISAAALVLGTVLAVAGTVALLGPLEMGPIAVGTALSLGYLAFVVALAAVMATVTRTAVTTIFAVLAVTIALPMLGLVAALKPWLPSELVVATLAMSEGAGAREFARSTLVTVAAVAGMLWVATRRLASREL